VETSGIRQTLINIAGYFFADGVLAINEYFMTAIICFAGFSVAFLFAAAGYRAMNRVRYGELKRKFIYHGRVQALYDGAANSGLLSPLSILRRAAIANSSVTAEK
jgi:hypothetical protein